jgi:transcriptional regulator with XRE-family HTH domain
MVQLARRLPKTKIAARRRQLRIKQTRVAELTGIPVRQLRRLENDEIKRIPLAYLVNLAQVLDMDDPLDLAEDEWLEWQILDSKAAEPPPREHWLPERDRG